MYACSQNEMQWGGIQKKQMLGIGVCEQPQVDGMAKVGQLQPLVCPAKSPLCRPVVPMVRCRGVHRTTHLNLNNMHSFSYPHTIGWAKRHRQERGVSTTRPGFQIQRPNIGFFLRPPQGAHPARLFGTRGGGHSRIPTHFPAISFTIPQKNLRVEFLMGIQKPEKKSADVASLIFLLAML